MRRRVHALEDRAFRLGAATAGGVLFVGAGLAADLARGHMILLGTVCGAGPDPHCGWCFGAAGLALAGLAAVAVAILPERAAAAAPSA
ncbi:hypothetical protein [Phenylobacterium sp.]|uniref:hypothetical protein n=1 Tax=Phenylobacterium sp. TaxID=1871053 RepID=UPI0025F805F7|nr:hypothetical protein [Phenylobacterium sp.]MBX3485469.1 hypothetical protein [Phenylobacterium sp.]MCW5758795.1 hypothetical protein [Phenylobacterium sp.]